MNPAKSKGTEKEILVRGVPASPGIARGKAKVILGPEEMGKMGNEDILVAPYTSPDYTPAILKACAIVTDIGGILSHAAIVSRESGIPCVVGTGEATGTLKDDMEVIVDGNEGIVYQNR